MSFPQGKDFSSPQKAFRLEFHSRGARKKLFGAGFCLPLGAKRSFPLPKDLFLQEKVFSVPQKAFGWNFQTFPAATAFRASLMPSDTDAQASSAAKDPEISAIDQ
jgi:hypothetical protein